MRSYTFEFDLSLDMQPEEGVLTFSEDGAIRGAVHDIGEVICLPVSQIEEILVKAGVGCGLIYVKQKSSPTDDVARDRILCRFTMSGLKRAGDFCKVVNYYIQVGIGAGPSIIPEGPGQKLCPLCGQPLLEEIKTCVFCYDKLSVLARASSYMRPYKKALIVSSVLFVTSSILYLTFPLLNRHLIDNFLRPQAGTAAQIIWIAAAMLLLRLMAQVFFISYGRIYNQSTIAYCNDLRNIVYGKLQYQSMASFAKRTPGDIIRRIMDDTARIREFITDAGRWASELALDFTLVLLILLFTNWQLTLLIFLPVPMVAVFLAKFWAFIRSRYERQWRKSSKCQSILHDIIKGIRTVKAFGNEESEIKKYAAAERELAQISSDNEAIWAKLFPTVTFFTSAGEFIILLAGGYAVLRGDMSLGVMVQFVLFVGFIYGPLRILISFPRWLGEATTSMVKIFEILDEEPEIAEQGKNAPIAGGVEFRGVTFGYKSYEPVLKGIDLKIKPGEMVGIVGKSGAGKSTLINLVMRLYDPNMGQILINDIDLRDISPRHLHENIGVVFQDSFLFAGSFYDNIAYAKPGATHEEVISAAKSAGAHGFIIKSPDGYNTLIGEGGESISGGERQRLSIARAIIKNPDILILDEATSSLDVETEKFLQDSLSRLAKGRTTIAIAHRLSTLRNADRLIVLDKGGVAELGTHTELLRKRGIYYNLVMAQRKSAAKVV